MKIKRVIIFLVLNIFIFGESAIPKIERIEGLKPWWIENHENIEGVLEGIGVVYKGNKESGNLRIEAMELAKREISSIKNTTIDSVLVLEESNIDKSLNISTTGTTKAEVKAVLIDTYEDENNYYAFMVEFKDNATRENFIEFLKDNNRKFLENKNQYIKYLNKIVITNKKRSKITINAGINKGLQKNEILNVYRLTEANLNPFTKELNDFSKEKVGEIVISESFDNQALAYSDIYSTFKIKEGDIAVKTGEFQKDKEEIKLEKIDKLKKTYNYNFDYEPQVLNVERAFILGPRQYELSLMSDFSDRLSGGIKTGLLRFIEGGINFDSRPTASLEANIKVAFPVFKTTNIGLAYAKDFSEESISSIVGLIEYRFYDGMGMIAANYTSPIGKKGKNESIGVSLQMKPDKNVLLGAEYVNKEGNKVDDYLALKVNLKVIGDYWLGGGVIWDEDRSYFLKVSRVMVY